MSKIAFMFPGQGSQKVGMMKDLYDNYSVVKDVFKEADEALGFSMTDLCFKGPEEQLRLTYNTQPAILTCSVAAMKVLEENEIIPSVVAGHSLGEYSACLCRCHELCRCGPHGPQERPVHAGSRPRWGRCHGCHHWP